MLNFFKDFLPIEKQTGFDEFTEDQKIQVAACTLLIEAARADSDYSDDEYRKVTSILKEMYSLNNMQIKDLMELAEQWRDKSVSIYEFTDVINKHFNPDEKYELVKKIWEVVYSDNVLDKYEEHLVRIISNNLNLSHRDMIAAKLEAKNK